MIDNNSRSADTPSTVSSGSSAFTLPRSRPLVVAGVINACCALLAAEAGIQALYLSGSGVATACYGMPDLALTTLTEVAEEVRRITAVTTLPLLVDADTGWGAPLMVARTTKILETAGAAALHLEDQPFAKRCGHREGKRVVSSAIMTDRIKAAVDARRASSFAIVARTDALAVEGLESTQERARGYVAAGADIIFVEGATLLSHYTAIKEACGAPILANLTEFGVTPIWSVTEVAAAGVDIALFPLTAFRAMNRAAATVYKALVEQGSARDIIAMLQTRQELYQLLHYETWEEKVLTGKEVTDE